MEPITTIVSVAAAAYKLYETSEFVGGLVNKLIDKGGESVVKYSATKISKHIHDRLIATIEEPTNHDVQCAVRNSYLKATLLAVEYEVNRPKEDFTVDPIQIKQDLNEIKSYLKNQLELLKKGHTKYEKSAFDEAYSELIAPSKTEKDMVSKLQENILQEFSGQQIRISNGLRSTMISGWVDNKMPVDWYKLMCAFFTEELKTNTRLSTYIQTKYLDDLSIDTAKISVTIDEIKDHLEEWRVAYSSLMGKVEEILAKIEAIHHDVKKGNAEQSIIHSKVDVIQATVTNLANAKQSCLSYENLKLLIADLKQKENEIIIEIRQWKELIQSSSDEAKSQLFTNNLQRLEKEHLFLSQQIGEYSKDLIVRNEEIAKLAIPVPTDSSSKRLGQAQLLIEEKKFTEAAEILNERDIYTDLQILDQKQKEARKPLAYELIKLGQLTIVDKRENWEELAYRYYKDAVKLHRNYYTCFEFASFLTQQKKFRKAIKYYIQSLARAENDAEKAWTLSNLGIVQRATAKFDDAENSYSQALKILRKLADTNPASNLPNVAKVLNSLGVLQVDITKFVEAKESYLEALEIRRQLAVSNPETFMPDVAQTLNNLGNLQCDTQKFEEAEYSYKEALKICSALAKENPTSYLPSLAAMLNNLGTLHMDTTKFEEAKQYHIMALKIRRELAETNPAANLPDVAMSLNNLGGMQVESNLSHKQVDPKKFEEAEANYREALRIRRLLAESNSATYLPKIARTLNNLGILQEAIGKFMEAEQSFIEALIIRRGLFKKNALAFSIDLATTCVVLSTLYTKGIVNRKLSFQYALEALKISNSCLHVPLAVEIHTKAQEIINYWESLEEAKDQ